MNTALGKPDANWKSPYTQQGDLLIKKCGRFGVFETEYASIPKNADKVSSNLVLKGQNNSHALYGGKFELLTSNNVLFIKVEEATVLDHVKDRTTKEKGEHHAQWIPPGEYFVDSVQERDHIKEESRAVID